MALDIPAAMAANCRLASVLLPILDSCLGSFHTPYCLADYGYRQMRRPCPLVAMEAARSVRPRCLPARDRTPPSRPASGGGGAGGGALARFAALARPRRPLRALSDGSGGFAGSLLRALA